MFCRNCGREVVAQAVACPGCGMAPRQGTKFCPNCAGPTQPNQVACTKCGVGLAPAGATAGAKGPAEKKLMAGILGIVLGGLGIHKFVLGYNKEGGIMLGVCLAGFFLSFLTCGITGIACVAMWVIGLIEGILYLTKSDEEFVNTYVTNKKGWF